MHLQRQKTREVKGKRYFRWTVVIPPSQIRELGWVQGEQLRPRLKKKRLIIEKA